MVDPILCDHHPPPQASNMNAYNHPSEDIVHESALPIPPLDPDMLAADLILPDDFADIDFNFDVDFDFNFDADDLAFTENIILPNGSDSESPNQPISRGDSSLEQISSPKGETNPIRPDSISPQMKPFKSGFMEREGYGHSGFDDQGSENMDSDGFRVSPCTRQDMGNSDGVLSGTVSSHESGDLGPNVGKTSNCPISGSDVKQKLDCPSPDSGSCNQDSSHGSAEYNSAVSHADSDHSENVSHYLQYSPLAPDNIVPNGSIDGPIKAEDIAGSKCMSKRKKETEDGSAETRSNKFKRSTTVSETSTFDMGTEDDKRKARLMRNRESAQLSRQRKKQYVEELEDKVKNMQSTIADLNGKISYIMAENASLRQQLGGAGVCQAPPPGMYPMAPMGYPWMPCPPYVIPGKGSQVPLVPIPRLKPQQPAPAPKVNKANKKSDSKKSEGKTKKVASISFLGLVFFILLFGGLVPIVNFRHGGLVEKTNINAKFSDSQKGRAWAVDDHVNGTNQGRGNASGYCRGIHCRRLNSDAEKKDDRDSFGHNGNSSEPLVASLYVPRNDKLVKIDGNLIIHSVLASEKAKATTSGQETSLAIHRNYVPYPGPGSGRSNGRHSHYERDPSGRQRALGPGSRDDLTSAASDGKLQQWFREGLAGPMLSSGMCTEVFQFDVSPTPGAIVPATSSMAKSSSGHQKNSTKTTKTNRRILEGDPIGRSLNITEEHVIPKAENDGLQSNRSLSSMVVSVLVDPREVGDGGNDGESVIKPKSLPRIFVVVLIDSVKYVTYSCMLPLIGSGSHLVTA